MHADAYADEKTTLRLAKKGCVGIIPEGIAGVFEGATPDHERIFLSRRKGFVRVAIQAGTDLVPVYHLGQSKLLNFYGNQNLSRKWGFLS